MSMSTDLMGLGLPPLLALKTSSGGTGPLTVSAAGTAYASGTKIGGSQYLVSVTNTSNGAGVSLPTVGGDTGAYLADDFIINNAGTTSLNIFCPAGTTISVQGNNTSIVIVSQHTAITLYPISATQWIGVKGS